MTCVLTVASERCCSAAISAFEHPRVSTAVAVRAKRSGAVPTWVAWALALVQVFALPLSVVGGGLVAGAIWLAVGYLMLIGGLGRAAVSPAAA
jgi:hypothetical protein